MNRRSNAPTDPQAQTQTEAHARRQKAHRRADQLRVPTWQTNTQGRQGRTNSRRERRTKRDNRTASPSVNRGQTRQQNRIAAQTSSASRHGKRTRKADRDAQTAGAHRAPNRPAANTGALLPHTERPAEPETGIRRVYPYIGHRAALETRRSQRGSARRGHSAGAVSRRRRQSCRAFHPRRHSPDDALRGGNIRLCR